MLQVKSNPDSTRTDRKGPVYPVTAINILKARGKSARESRHVSASVFSIFNLHA